MALRAAEIETLFTANVDQVVKAEQTIKQTGQRVEKNPLKVDADAKPALEGMDRVEQAAKRLVSKDTIATVDANIERGEKNLDRVQKRLDYLRSVETEMDVKADISRAEASLSKVQRNLDGLKSARAVMEVDADTSGAESALDDVQGEAGEAGEDSGEEFGKSIIAALASIPIAGAVIGILAAAGKAGIDAFQEGLQVEVGYDRLQALTGLDEAAAQRLGNAAGQAYADNFGESIESNMDATRLALQFRILDPDATTRDAQLVVQGLAGIADVLGEDVEPVARAVTQLMRTGLVKSSEEAFDVLAAGARKGVNANNDLLDTFNEYSTHFRDLGLTGGEALGLLNQGLEGGAFNADKVADALKEMSIQIKPAKDGSIAAADALEALGLNAEATSRAFVEGGPAAREALEGILTELRNVEDPLERNALALGIFGTQAEDMAGALLNLDLTTAVDQLDGVTGSAQRMFDTLADNDASKISQAQRNIEVAAQGIQGALASAFSEPLGELAEFVSQNRGPVLQFLSDMVNGALDFGESVVEGAASGTEALGEFVGSLSKVVNGLAAIPYALGDKETGDAIVDMANGMLDFAQSADETADTIRTNLGGAIDTARSEFNNFAEPQIALGYVNDAALRTADSVSQVGLAADGTRLAIEGLDTANLRSSESGRALDDQLKASASSLNEEYLAALLAGESQANLTDRYNATRDALMSQLTAMGLSQEQAQALIDTVLQTPEEAYTVYSSNAEAQAAIVDSLTQKVIQLPDGSFAVVATNVDVVEQQLDDLTRRRTVWIDTVHSGLNTDGRTYPGRASGGPIWGPGGPRDDLIPIMASNGEHMLTAAEVTAAGGHEAIYRLRRALLGGSLKLADGGPVRVPASTWQVPQFPASMLAPQWASMLAPAATPVAAQQSLVGLRVEGTFDMGSDGLIRLVDGRVVEAVRTVTRSTGGRR